jgi:hypothetical protein
MSPVEHDVGRNPGSARFAGEFECSPPPARSCKSDHEFLGCEVARVLERVNHVAAEADRERPPERDSDRDPCLHGRPAAETTLEVADLRLAESHHLAQPGLRQASSPSRRSRLTPEVRGDRPGLANAGDACRRPPRASHNDAIVAAGAALAISSRPERSRWLVERGCESFSAADRAFGPAAAMVSLRRSAGATGALVLGRGEGRRGPDLRARPPTCGRDRRHAAARGALRGRTRSARHRAGAALRLGRTRPRVRPKRPAPGSPAPAQGLGRR